MTALNARMPPVLVWMADHHLYVALTVTIGILFVCAALAIKEQRLGRDRASPAPPATSGLVPRKIISFEYIQSRSPLQEGWVIAEDDKKGVSFSIPIDAPTGGCMHMNVAARFAMDFDIKDINVQQCSTLDFKAKMPNLSALYAGVRLRDGAGGRVDSGKDGGIFWLTYRPGDCNLEPVRDDRYPNERIMWVSGQLLGNDWFRYIQHLPKDVERAYTGLIFSSLAKIRVRNSLSVSPIWIF